MFRYARNDNSMILSSFKPYTPSAKKEDSSPDESFFGVRREENLLLSFSVLSVPLWFSSRLRGSNDFFCLMTPRFFLILFLADGWCNCLYKRQKGVLS